MTHISNDNQIVKKIESGLSTANYNTIFNGFKAKGILEEDIKPRENVFTFGAWKALGRSIKKGEHGVKITGMIETAKKNEHTDKIETIKYTKPVTVFHISQTEESHAKSIDTAMAVSEDHEIEEDHQKELPVNTEKLACDPCENIDKSTKDTEIKPNYAEDIPQDIAMYAFYNTSFDPERRAKNCIEDYSQMLNHDFFVLKEQAEKGGTLDKLDAIFSRYREGFKKRFLAWLNTQKRCASSAIVGGANFHVKRMQKRNEINDRRLEEVHTYREKRKEEITKQLRPDLRPVMSGDDNALERLEEKLAKRIEKQKKMKAVNKMLKKYENNDLKTKVSKIVKLGFDIKEAIDICSENNGFQQFELINNNAEINRLKKRLEQISKTKEKPVFEKQCGDVRVEDDPPSNRVRLFFDAKPANEVLANLKKHGFRWAPTLKAWQAYRNSTSFGLVRSFLH